MKRPPLTPEQHRAKHAAREARAARYLASLERGITTTQLAAQDGLTRQAISTFMRGMGMPSSALEAIKEKDSPHSLLTPLTEDQVFASDAIMEANSLIGLQMWRLMPLIRAIERAHGIGTKS
jgi:hypothetical protein